MAISPSWPSGENSLAGYTSGGEQQMCAIGRALMSRPKMILLDEPSMGLAPQIVEEIFEIVKDLNEKEGVSFLLAEQNTNMALRFARYGYILENGRVVMDGDAKSLVRERGRQGILPRHFRGPAQILPRRQALPPAEALAGVSACPTTTTPWKPATRRCASASSSRALPGIVARAMTAPGWAKHLAGVDPKSVNLARRAGASCRCCASRTSPPCRRKIRRSAASTSPRPARHAGC